MNPEHLRAFVWLRWRLRVNQLKKGGIANVVVLALVASTIALLALGTMLVCFLVGLLALPDASPAVVTYVWDAVVLGFLFCWMIGLLADLQRTDSLALDKFLHLPVSLLGAFLVNYVSSLASVTLFLFVPGVVGLILGMAIGRGPMALLDLPLAAAFLFAVTAVTYQFQGWLASLMTNPRRRRTVIVLVTAGFVLLAQLPNLVNILTPRKLAPQKEDVTRLTDRQAEARKDLTDGRLNPAEFRKRIEAIQQEHKAEADEPNRQEREQAERAAWVLNVVLPPGWLPLGAGGLADGNVLPALVGGLGLTLIGAASLRRGYRATVKLYTGATGSADKPTAAPAVPTGQPRRPRLVEWKLPWVSEPVAAVALAGFRSMIRAPEAKMVLIVPVILVVVFGAGFASLSDEVPEVVRPLLAFGAGTMALLCCVQLVGNQFGYDRAGFRAYVLSPVPRRAILLGKNLAVAPFAAALCGVVILAVGVILPMRFDHLLAVAVQLAAMFLVFCLMGNALSIVAPIPMAAGAIQPSNVKLVPILFQMLFLTLFPFAAAPVLAPLGIEVLVEQVGGVRGIPICLLLSLVVLAATVLLYGWLLTPEGDWLTAREKAILEVVTSKLE